MRELNEVEPGGEARPGQGAGQGPAAGRADPGREPRDGPRRERLLIVETLSGWICANAGIDASNVPGTDRVTLLPEDADASARRIRAEIGAATGVRPAVVITDSFGRPWRLGQTDVAIGCAGFAPLDDWRGRTDAEGRRARRDRGRRRRPGRGGRRSGAAQGHGCSRLPGPRPRALRQPPRTGQAPRRYSRPKPKTCFRGRPAGSGGSALVSAFIGSGWPSSVNSAARRSSPAMPRWPTPAPPRLRC